MKVQGRLTQRDLEGGFLQLEADSGERYTLVGASGELKRAAGGRVEIEGAVEEGASFTMAGPLLRVRSFKSL